MRATRNAPKRSAILLVATLAAAVSGVSAQETDGDTNWPQFRGVQAGGIAEGAETPVHWNAETGENILWKTPIPGLGHSSPIVWGDLVCMTTAVSGSDDEDVLKVGLYGDIAPVVDDRPWRWEVRCLDKTTGAERWTAVAHQGVPAIPRHPKATHANSTLATDGASLIAMFGSEGLYGYELETGREVWRVDLGVLDATSPVIHDGLVVIQADVINGSFLAVFDVATGAEVWRVERDEVPTWSTPTVHVVDGRAQIVVNGYRHIGAYDLATGEEVWRMTGGGDIPTPAPIVDDGLIFITNSHGAEAPIFAISEGATGDITPAAGALSNDHLVWSRRRDGAYMQTPIVYDGLLYNCRTNGVLSAYEPRTGRRLYQQRIGGGGGFSASAVAANGMLYYSGEDGTVHVVKAGPEFELLAENPMGETLMATPAISDGVLFIRTRGHLVAVAPPSRQGAADPAPWFGLPLPPGLSPHATPLQLGSREPVPAVVPSGEETHVALDGETIRRDLETIVGFSKNSHARREIGDGQLWGRITGFPSGSCTVAWAVDEFRGAGIDDVELQRFDQDPDASFWLPLSWDVRLVGDERFGDGSRDVVLETAMPLAPSEIEGTLTAPLVHVGTGTAAELTHVDVAGKVAVRHVTPQAHTLFERRSVVSSAQALFGAGAVAVINVIDQPDNERARDFSDCGGPCFNLGGRDGLFLESVMNAAAEANTLDDLRIRLELTTGTSTGLSAENGVAVIPGRRDATIHADAWFDGAGDNADGLAVVVALARHFARPEHRPERTLVFVASAGHHSPGLHGPRQFVAMNPDLAGRAVVVLNVEHVAQRGFSPARSFFEDGYQQFVTDVGELPVVAGVSNGAPFLEELVAEGVARYGVNFVSDRSTMASGEGGGYRQLGVALVTTLQASPLYHTSGEVAEVISTPGLERIARFLAFFIAQVDQAPADRINQ